MAEQEGEQVATVNNEVNNEKEESHSQEEKRWIDSRTEVLILLLKDSPCLYNTSIKEYKNRDLKKKALEEMASKLEITEKEVKAKIKSLRTTYSREKGKKKKRKTGTGVDEIDQKTWKFFELLRFLDDFVIPKVTVSNISTTNEDHDDELELSETSEYETQAAKVEAKLTKRPLTKKGSASSKKMKLQKEDILLDKAIECMKKSTYEANHLDEFEIFGKYVAHELREISNAQTRRWVKWNIQNTLYSAHETRQQFTMPTLTRPFPPGSLQGTSDLGYRGGYMDYSRSSTSRSPISSSDYDNL